MSSRKKEKPRHLGRGLESLLGPIKFDVEEAEQRLSGHGANDNFPLDKQLHSSLRQIPIDAVKPNPYQPRIAMDQQQLDDLAESIRSNGVIQPIIVRPAGTEFELIAGERRLRAAELASLTTIPALVRTASDEQLLELALIENIHRTDLNPIERAGAYRNYLNTFSLTQAQAAERLGEDRSVIANHLRLLELPDEVKQMLVQGQLMMGHARAVLSLPTDELRRKLANRALADRLSVREVERLVRKYTAPDRQTDRAAAPKPPHIMDLESKLTSELGTKVAIETRKSGQRGKIVIEFYSLDEFDRITGRLGLTQTEQV